MKTLTSYLLMVFMLSFNISFGQFGEDHLIIGHTLNANSVFSADIDNDGNVDILSSSDSKIAWYRNDGNGNIGIQQIISTNTSWLSGVYATDIDGDGNIDVIFGSSDNKIVWYKNDGNGNFGTQQVITTNVASVISVSCADIDGDGDMDVLTASWYYDEIAWYKNDGNGNFGTKQIISTNVDNVTCVYAVDLDSDGEIDVLFASSGDDRIAWCHNDGNGNFGTQQVITTNVASVRSVYSADIDGDGDMDVLSASSEDEDNKIAWYQNDGNGNFGTQQVISTNTSWLSGVYAADIDGDGDIDVFLYGKKISWCKNDGSGNFGVEQVITTNVASVKSIYSADIDGDGNTDILSASNNDSKIAWYKNDGIGNFGNQQIITAITRNIKSIHSADIDGDGYADVLSASSGDNKIAWCKNYGNGNFGHQQIISTNANNATCVYSADIDGDGIVDVLSASSSNDRITWYRNDGNGNFGTQQIISTNADNANSVYAVDLDGDGDIDVLSASIGDNKIAWYQNDGNGNFGNQQIISNSVNGATIVYASDIDNDNDMDVFSVSSYDKRIAWYQNDGSGNFGSPQIISTNTFSPNSIFTTDINGDGNLDLVSSFKYNSNIVWYQNDGTGNFENQKYVSLNIDSVNCSIYPVDIDGDGDIDILSQSNIITWHQNDGNGNFEIQQTTSTSSCDAGIYAFDINNDGDLDIISPIYSGIKWIENLFNSQYKIKGKIFYDVNQNGINDNLDYGLSFVNTQLNPNALASYTNIDGNYWFAVDTGNYLVSYLTTQLWNLTSDSVEYYPNVSTGNPVIDNLDFGFFPDTFLTSINPELTISNLRCDENANLWINYQNIGTTTPNGIIELILDTQLTFINSSVTPDSVINNSFYWHLDSINYFTQDCIYLIVLSPDFNSIGDTFTDVVNIYTTDNTGQHFFSDTLSEQFGCGYDPNDKLVTPRGEGTNGIISNSETLEYTVRFQNTGNAEAINIKIRDQIDEDLDIQTVKILASSHNVQAYTQQNNWLVFQFDSIMLPDSSTSFLESQGFVKYSIKVSDSALPNAPIHNTANIYFDNNPAVLTNTTLNTVECYITPTAPSIEVINTVLSVTTPYQVQWYVNDTVIFGATDTSYYITTLGNYTVEVFDDNGCSSFSDVFMFTNINKQNSELDVNIYPNPTTGLITVDAKNIEQISILNINGKQVFTTNKNSFDLSVCPKGIYIVKIATQNAVIVKKVILE